MIKADMKTILKSGFCMMSILLALAACSAPTGKSPESGTEKANVAAPEVEIADDFKGDGMEMPLDGSSVEAFDASLAMVKKHTNAENYRYLEKAIGYMMAFDISVRNNKARLVSRLNGLNGYEVIAKAGIRKPPKGDSSVKKSAADVKTLDT